jgi:hypothetical protein
MRGAIKVQGVMYVFLVLGPGHPGAGRIKKIPLEKNINSSLIEWEGDVCRISKQEEASGFGSRFLHDLYEDEGKPERFTVYGEWVQAGAEGRTLDVPEFPDDLLPAKVIEWRRRRKKASAQFDPTARLKAMGADVDAPAVSPTTPAPVPPPVDPTVPPHPPSASSANAGRGQRPARVEPRIPVTIPLPSEGSRGDE